VMSDASDTRDRVIGLERDFKHLSAKVEETHEKVVELHSLLLQAKGVRWALGVVLAIGSFVGGLFGGKIGIWFGVLPR
jgi:hypothetical protein